MSLTMDEVRERVLARYDAEDLLEALDITSEELLDRFEDKFINRLAFFEEDVNGELEDDKEDEDEY
jgi:hypothetical protein